jgi:hypothetical protein
LRPQFTRAAIVIAISATGTACVNSRPYKELTIDHAGFAGRLRRACELARSKAGSGACSPDETMAEETWDEMDAGVTADGGDESDDGGAETSPDVISQHRVADPS